MADIAYVGEANQGWISVERAIRIHNIVGFGKPVPGVQAHRGAFSRAEAWLDMLMMAQHRVTTWINKGRKTELQIGQFPGAYSFLADRWNWSTKTVRNFLEKLREEGMLEKPSADESGSEKGKQRGNQVQVLTISNYRIYQVAREIERQEKGQAKGKRRASEGQQLNNETIKQEDSSPIGDMSSAPPIDLDEARKSREVGTAVRVAAAAVAGIMASALPAAATPPMEPPAHMQQQLPGVPAPAPKTMSKAEAVTRAVEIWNEIADRHKLAKVRILNKQRETALFLRIKEAKSFQAFAEAMRKVESSPFLLGQNNTGWRASFDFVLQPSSFAKLLEGVYDRGSAPSAPAPTKAPQSNFSFSGAYVGRCV